MFWNQLPHFKSAWIRVKSFHWKPCKNGIFEKIKLNWPECFWTKQLFGIRRKNWIRSAQNLSFIFSGNGLHPSLDSKRRFWKSDRDMPDQNLLAQTSKDVLLTKDVQLKSQRSGDKAKLMPLFALGFPVLAFEWNCYEHNLRFMKLEFKVNF